MRSQKLANPIPVAFTRLALLMMLCRAVLSWQQPALKLLPRYSSRASASRGDTSTLQRLFVKSPLRPGARLVLEPEQSHYLLSVLRLKPAMRVRVFNGLDGEFLAALDEDSEDGVVVSKRSRAAKRIANLVVLSDEPCLRPQPSPSETSESHLVFAVIKPKPLRLVVEKATELGVSVLHPVVTERVQGRQQGDGAEDMSKLQTITIEASEQSDRLTVPVVESSQSLEATVANIIAKGAPVSFFVCEERSDTTVPLLDALASDRRSTGSSSANRIDAFLVGPEGGWAPGELDRVLNGVVDANRVRLWRVSLGPGILRAETASLYALATWNAFQHSREELSQ